MIRYAFPLLLALAVPTVSAQALIAPPPVARTDTEVELAKIDSVTQVLQQAAEYRKAGDWRRYSYAMKRIIELRPYAGSAKVELAAAYAMLDMKQEAFDGLVRMQASGYAWDLSKDERFKNLHGTGLWDYLLQNYAANAVPFGKGKLETTLPGGDVLLESLAWDAKRGKMLAGSVRTGEISVVDGGKLMPLVKPDKTNGLWGAFDLFADAKSDRLWVASSAIPHVKHAAENDYGRAALLAFKLSDGSFVAKYPVPDDGRPHLLTAVTANTRGDVFVADMLTAQVFKLEGDALRLVVQNPRLATIHAIAATADNRFLYFADHELGLFGLDLATGRAFDVLMPDHFTPWGIESLYAWNGQLVAVQNAFPPKRVMRLTMSADGHRIERAKAVDAAQKPFELPTRGAVAGDRLLLIANSQKGKYDGEGKPVAGAKLEGAKVWSSDLTFTMPGADEVKAAAAKKGN
jgi:hypothetical protein